MWIIPKTLSAFVPDTEGLNLALSEQAWMLEQSAMWRSKHSSKQTWLRRLKKGDFIQLLFLRTLKPSHSESFLEKYLSSVEDSHVSPLVKLVSEKQPMTQDICIPLSQKESLNANQLSFFSKMSKESSQPKPTKENLYSTMSAETWKAEVTKCRGEYSVRKNAASLIREKECSSLAFPTPKNWSTPTARDFKDSPNDKTGLAMTLGRQVNGWKPKSQRDQTNLNTNGNTQESLPKGYLNPSWVESLMGLEIGTTDLGYSEMESCHK